MSVRQMMGGGYKGLKRFKGCCEYVSVIRKVKLFSFSSKNANKMSRFVKIPFLAMLCLNKTFIFEGISSNFLC